MKRIDVLGLSNGLAPAAREILMQADLVIGSARQLSHLPPLPCRTMEYPSPLHDLASWLRQSPHQRLVLMASGDPLFHGIGTWLQKHASAFEIHYNPQPSSVQLAFNLLGKPWQDATVVNLHGRPLANLRRHLLPGRTLAVLTDDDNHPGMLARELASQGFAESVVYICENLGGGQQQSHRYQAGELAEEPVGQPRSWPINVTIIEVRGRGSWQQPFPGLDDASFITGEDNGRGQITKKEIRLQVLNLLQARCGDTIWDLGCGCGSVAVELALWQPGASVLAVEKNPQRARWARENSARFGVQGNLRIEEGDGGDAIGRWPAPDAVFVGGHGGNLASWLPECWRRLRSGGRLVVSSVTESTRHVLYNFAASLDTDGIQIQANWLECQLRKPGTLGHTMALVPALPVLMVQWRKP